METFAPLFFPPPPPPPVGWVGRYGTVRSLVEVAGSVRGEGLHGFGKGGKGRVGKEGRGRGEDLWDGQRSISCFPDPSFFPRGTRPFFFFFFFFRFRSPLPLFPSTGVGRPVSVSKGGFLLPIPIPGVENEPTRKGGTLDCDGNGNTTDTPKPTSVPSHLEGTRS